MIEKTSLLAIDPGLREMGYAHFDSDDLIDQNAKSLRRPGSKPSPLVVFNRLLARLLVEKKPQVIAIEMNSFQQIRQNLPLMRAIQRVRIAARRHGIRLYAFAPNTIKKAVTGDGYATKRTVARALCSKYPELKVHLGTSRKWQERFYQNMFDAVACGLTWLILKDSDQLFKYEA